VFSGAETEQKDGIVQLANRIFLSLPWLCAATAAFTPIPCQASQENYEAVLAAYEGPPPTVVQLNTVYNTLVETMSVDMGGNTQVANATVSSGGNGLVADLTADLHGLGLSNAQMAIAGVKGLLDGQANNPVNGELLLSTLASLTPAQQARFFSQVQPSMIGSAQTLTTASLNTNSGFFGAVDGRLQTARRNEGLSAGDDAGRGFTVWATPYGDIATQRMTNGVSGYTASTYGLAIGGDMPVRSDPGIGNLRIGLAAALSNTDIAFADVLAGNKSRVLTAQAGVYGTWYAGRFFLDGAATLGYSWYNTTENLDAFGFTRSSGYTGAQLGAKIVAGYDLDVHGIRVTPSIGFQETHLNIAPHTTKGGRIFDLSVSGQSIDVTQLKIGSRFAYSISPGHGWRFTPEVYGFYVRNLNTTAISTSASFLTGGAFTVTAPARDADIAELGVGLTVARDGPFVVSARYDYAFGRTTSDGKFSLRVKWEF